MTDSLGLALMAGRQRGDRSGSRLVFVAIAGFLLFTPPLLALFDHHASVFGLPDFVVYLFVSWAVIIGLVAALSRGPGPPRE
jgi:hypothetical protein